MKDLYSIPVVLNITIIVICASLFFFLFQAGVHTPVISDKTLLGLAFGLVMVPIYSLIHELTPKKQADDH